MGLRHAVIGAGNLGLDIATLLRQQSYEVEVFSKVSQFKYPCSIETLLDYRPDHVWVAVGAGSIGEAQKNYAPFADLHIRLVIELAQKLPPNVTLHTFSTDFLLDGPPKSLYALSKLHMEETLKMMNRPNTFIYRVGYLYGSWKPQKCFPYELKRRNPRPTTLTIPSNRVVPTPTDWVAKQLVHWLSDSGCEAPTILNIFPNGTVPRYEWAQKILGDRYTIAAGDLDATRPDHNDSLGCDLALAKNTPSWEDLWNEHSNAWTVICGNVEKGLEHGHIRKPGIRSGEYPKKRVSIG